MYLNAGLTFWNRRTASKNNCFPCSSSILTLIFRLIAIIPGFLHGVPLPEYGFLRCLLALTTGSSIYFGFGFGVRFPRAFSACFLSLNDFAMTLNWIEFFIFNTFAYRNIFNFSNCCNQFPIEKPNTDAFDDYLCCQFVFLQIKAITQHYLDSA